MKSTQDLSVEDFDLFSRCVEAAIEISMKDRDERNYSVPIFQINRISRKINFRYEYHTTWSPEKWNWAFDSETGLSGPCSNEYPKMREFYILYKLLSLHFLDDEELIDEMWNWKAPKWENSRGCVDRLYKIKALYLGAKCSGDNHWGSELSESFLYKVKWETVNSEITSNFVRILQQKEHISLTRYSKMFKMLCHVANLSINDSMRIMRNIDRKITAYVNRRIHPTF